MTFSSLINLGKQSAIDEMEENMKHNGLNNILADFMKEFRLTKSQLETATKQMFNVTSNQDSEKRPWDGLGLNVQENIFSFLDDYTSMLKNEENIYNTMYQPNYCIISFYPQMGFLQKKESKRITNLIYQKMLCLKKTCMLTHFSNNYSAHLLNCIKTCF